MGVNDNIPDFATSDGNGDGTYTVTRAAAGSSTKGRFTAGAPSTFPIEAVVEPATGGDLQVIPEGMRVTDVRVIISATELRPTAGSPDRITINGETYAVFHVDGPFELDGDVHWEALAARQVVP